jgi:hypothetical protein
MAHAQAPAVTNNVRAANILTRFASGQISPGDMTFGISATPPAKVIGDVYFDSHWGKSSIELTEGNRTIEGYYCRYDIQNNHFEILRGKEIRAIPGQKIKDVVWIDSLTNQPRLLANFTNYEYNEAPLTTFAEVLSDGEFKLLKRIALEILRPDFSPALNIGSKDFRIIKTVEYYYTIDKTLYKVKNAKSLQPLETTVPDKKLKEFIKRESINIKSEEGLKKIFNYLNG